jgi:hypothetical protein
MISGELSIWIRVLRSRLFYNAAQCRNIDVVSYQTNGAYARSDRSLSGSTRPSCVWWTRGQKHCPINGRLTSAALANSRPGSAANPWRATPARPFLGRRSAAHHPSAHPWERPLAIQPQLTASTPVELRCRAPPQMGRAEIRSTSHCLHKAGRRAGKPTADGYDRRLQTDNPCPGRIPRRGAR